MGKREEKRERAAYHDSRRYLKAHPAKRSDPLWGLRPEAEWEMVVEKAISRYPVLARRREADLRAGGLGGPRKGPSAEAVVLRCAGGGMVTAVERALAALPQKERRRVAGVCFGGLRRERTDTPCLHLFRRHVAVYLGYGRKRYDCRTF